MAQFRHLFVVAILVLALCQVSSAGRIRSTSNRAKRVINIVENPPKLIARTINIDEDATDAKCIDFMDNNPDDNIDLTSVEIHTDAVGGSVVSDDANPNIICYLPNPNFHGSDSFQYQVCDYYDQCEVGLVRVNVSPKNDAPTANNDFFVVQPNVYEITMDVLANDWDVDGRYVRRSSFKVVSPPKYGNYFVTPDKKIVYEPIFNKNARFSSQTGADTLVYEICDNERVSLCDYATVTIYVSEKCIACERCADSVSGFDLHLDRVHYFYDKDVLSVKH